MYLVITTEPCMYVVSCDTKVLIYVFSNYETVKIRLNQITKRKILGNVRIERYLIPTCIRGDIRSNRVYLIVGT